MIDEAHLYRDVLQKDYTLQRENKRNNTNLTNRVKDRLAEVARRGTKIVLLTATPYGTNTQNVNGLLHLLPHTAQNKGLLQEQGCWEIETLSQTADLPVVTMLGLTDVLRTAARLGDSEPESNGHLFIALANGMRLYLPKSIALRRREYNLFLEDEMQTAFADDLFNAGLFPFDGFDENTHKNVSLAADIIKNNAVRSWLSPPLETNRFLAMCCDKIDPPSKNADVAESLFEPSIFTDADAETHEVSDLPPKKSQLKTQEERIAGLTPIREKIALMTAAQDDKIARLHEILAEHFAQKHKVIVFVDRLATAYYLKTELATALPRARIGCTTGEQKADGRYPLVSAEQRKDTVCYFSPVSNRVENFNPKHELICSFAPTQTESG